MASQPSLWWEDLVSGSERELGSITVSRDDILRFAREFDPQPFHLDDRAGEASVFGGLCASGWHTCALAMRLMVTGFLNQSASLGSPGLDSVKWLKPVYPDDTLSLRHRIIESRPLNSRPGVGLVRTVWEMYNQRGEQVLHMDGYGMFRRRPAAPTEP